MQQHTPLSREISLQQHSKREPDCIALAVLFALTLFTAQAIHAQTFITLHNFTGNSDGANPNAGVTVGGSGTLYGTASGGGTDGNGVVYKLAQRGSSWTLDPLWEFTGGSDGGSPYAGVVIGPNGALYGTTFGGGGSGVGTVFEVRPPVTACKTAICYWNLTTLWTFAGAPNDGANPAYGSLAFDGSGNIYGTTYEGGAIGYGTVYELAPESGGDWMETILYGFTGGADGFAPLSGVIFDREGNLYGNNEHGGIEWGVVYQLMPAGPPWTENTLANFNEGVSGSPPFGTLVMDQLGNLYGTGENFSIYDGGAVYEVSPSGGNWTLSVVYAFGNQPPYLPCYPFAGVTLGPNGNLFGVCQVGGANNDGWVFEMPTTCNSTCAPTDLYDFTGTTACYAHGPVTFDASGTNLYGTCYGGGNSGNGCTQYGCGSVWELEGVTNRR